jgi:hypothetical protein
MGQVMHSEDCCFSDIRTGMYTKSCHGGVFRE